MMEMLALSATLLSFICHIQRDIIKKSRYLS